MDQTGSFTCLDDWLPWLETLSPRESDLGLDRVVTVLGRLDLPRAERVIIVAGTNGKGSSVAMLDALLADAGYRTACYTSPHLLRYNERIRIDGLAATDAEIITAFERVQSARQDVPLAYFEFGTVAALVDNPGSALFLTHAEWLNDVYVTGELVIPSTDDTIQVDCGQPGSPNLTDPVPATTWAFGDVFNDPPVALSDAFAAVRAEIVKELGL